MDNQFNKELDDSETNVRIIERGRVSLYWQLLDKEVDSRLKYFRDCLETYSKKGIKTESERLEYNRAVDNIDHLQWFKRINGKVLKDNQSVIDRIKAMVKETVRKVESFVK